MKILQTIKNRFKTIDKKTKMIATGLLILPAGILFSGIFLFLNMFKEL